MTDGNHPSVAVAYDIARESYSQISDRLDSVNQRLDNLLTLSASLTVAVPTVVKVAVPDIAFDSGLFIGAVVVFALTLIAGVLGRVGGTIRLTDPKKLYRKWLTFSENEFKRKYIWFAGKSFEKGRERVNYKGNLAICMAIGLCLEVLLLVAWIAAG